MRRKIGSGRNNPWKTLTLEGMGEARTGQGTGVEAALPNAGLTTLATVRVKQSHLGMKVCAVMCAPMPEDLMSSVVESGNMRLAFARVKANKGSAGVDGMTVKQLPEYLRQHWSSIRESLLAGSYRPQPIRRVMIPRPDGGERQLGIPTVLDRLIQQAVLQVLEPYYDSGFSPSSYGFSPSSYGFRAGKSAHQALEAARGYVAEGRQWVVDLDLEKFFDQVNHDVLMGLLRQRIVDKRVLRLIRGYLRAGILSEGVVVGRSEGTPQGGPLSPLLANILLDGLDKELEHRGLRFCRYADDCNIYVRSRRAGERVKASVTCFLKRKLRLRVNEAKSAVARPMRRKFLGQRILGGSNAYLGVHPKSVERLKASLRRLTNRHRNASFGQVVREVGQLCMGWVVYHRHARCATLLQELDRWLRRRLRSLVWVQWKTWRNRAQQLVKLGVGRYLAFGTAFNGDGPWRCAGSPALQGSLTDQWFQDQGFKSLHARYLSLNTSGTAGCGPARPVV